MFCLCGVLENLIGQHGESNVQGAMNNNMLGSLVGQLGQAIQCHPGIPQFAKDEMCHVLGSAQQSCPQEPTTPGCQRDTDDSMGGLIDKIVDKVVDMIMDKLTGGECKSGDFGDMLHDAVEEVVREQIGGGDDQGASRQPGGCTRTEANGKQSLDEADTKACEATSNLDKKKEEAKGGGKSGGNWIVELAKALAEIQTEFLDKAMDNLQTMKDNKAGMDTEQGEKSQGGGSLGGMFGGDKSTETQGGGDQEGSRGEFMAAQSEFQANFQMFNMMANMTATSLKSLGEGLTSIARKQ
jgi:hypothetical protein